jgi:hypothetical protein
MVVYIHSQDKHKFFVTSLIKIQIIHMENIFSSNSSEIIQKKIELISNDLSNNNQIKSAENLDYYFDLDKLTEWILQNNYKRVCYITFN